MLSINILILSGNMHNITCEFLTSDTGRQPKVLTIDRGNTCLKTYALKNSC